MTGSCNSEITRQRNFGQTTEIMAGCDQCSRRHLAKVVTFLLLGLTLYIIGKAGVMIQYTNRVNVADSSKHSYDPKVSNKRHQRIMDKACIEREQSRFADLLYKPPVHSHMLKVQHTHNIYYCPVQKVASTFWQRILEAIGSKSIKKLYVTDMDKLTHVSFVELWEGSVPKPRLMELLRTRFAFMFAREPYDRLLSAYVDKIYFPNIDYWPSLTQDIARVAGRPDSPGHDITFAETVKYLIYMNRVLPDKIDMHFQTITRLCNPCGIYYNFVGKFETIKEDTHFLLNYISQNYSDIELDLNILGYENRSNDIRSRTRKLFAAIEVNKFPRSMSKYEIFKRTWRHFCIRGYISKSIPFPISKNQASAMNAIQFENILINSLKSSMKKDDLERQHEEALLQAYDSVPYDDMLKLRKMFSDDCEIFGYNCKPPQLFDRTTRDFSNSKSKFQYFQIY